jgi:hypothetical protein
LPGLLEALVLSSVNGLGWPLLKKSAKHSSSSDLEKGCITMACKEQQGAQRHLLPGSSYWGTLLPQKSNQLDHQLTSPCSVLPTSSQSAS